MKYYNIEKGFNSRLDELQAALLRVKLPHIDAWNARRVQIAGMYLESLKDTDLLLPLVPDGMQPCWHLFVVRSKQRDALQTHLKQHGIGTVIHYPVPPHLQEAYRELNLPEGSFPISEAIHREVLSLPIGPHLNPQEAELVIEAVKSFR